MKKVKNKPKTRRVTIYDLIKKNPELADALAYEGLECRHCPLAKFETIDEGAFVHGIDKDELKSKISKTVNTSVKK